MIFPVKVPYTIGVDIKKYEGQVLDDYVDPEYIRQKKEELYNYYPQVCGVRDDYFTQYLTDYSGHVGSLEEIALQMNEDIAILKDGRVVSICFTFPSGFTPTRLLGMNFFEMHKPVPEGDKLRKASDNITALMTREGGLFRRHVWSLSSLSSLSQLPAKERPVPLSIDDIWFRTETQTMVGLRDSVTLFFIKVNMTPLKEFWHEDEKKKLLIEAVDSMSPDVLHYKGLTQIKEIIKKTT